MSSTLENFVDFQSQMVQKLQGIPEALGLMFAGSAADLTRVDQYSDQDFYLIVQDGTAEGFRQQLSWLPHHKEILLSPRETEHGLKVLYRDGTMLEFAVFEIGELPTHMAPTDNRVVFDRGGVQEIISRITFKPSKPFDPVTEYELFLTLIQIGVGRVKRGEVLAGSQHIKSYALNHLLGLVRHFEPGSSASEDALNRYRRFETSHTEIGKRLTRLIEGESVACASGMLEIASSLAVADEFREATAQVERFVAFG
jgi:hypothetical protein